MNIVTAESIALDEDSGLFLRPGFRVQVFFGACTIAKSLLVRNGASAHLVKGSQWYICPKGHGCHVSGLTH